MIGEIGMHSKNEIIDDFEEMIDDICGKKEKKKTLIPPDFEKIMLEDIVKSHSHSYHTHSAVPSSYSDHRHSYSPDYYGRYDSLFDCMDVGITCSNCGTEFIVYVVKEHYRPRYSGLEDFKFTEKVQYDTIYCSCCGQVYRTHGRIKHIKVIKFRG